MSRTVSIDHISTQLPELPGNPEPDYNQKYLKYKKNIWNYLKNIKHNQIYIIFIIP